MSSVSSRPQRSSSSISPFRQRKPPPLAGKGGGRPTTPTGGGRPPTPFVSQPSTSRPATPISDRPDLTMPKENVTVTVRFRPLSPREINKGDEIAWYADGDCTVRNEYNPAIAYGFDRVFGPATTTRHVYDVAAQHVVSGAMQGINGTVFAYGVTSSGKTHTMHGEQKSPGIIPLAVKDVFGIIQETPGREFLLRVSYLEIYNEVINDLLDPTGQNLRIREDSQGTYVEGIKEEVVLSPAHALALIASGEEHRHVGSNNFNLLSSRSHTIFTLTIEISPCGENEGEEDVTLSQLNLIDLAGSESSKTETTGLRRKEGSYINKSLLSLGTVIAKLTDGKATHIPYRDSKLTRLLQSSLSGHGRVSLICTVTPASSNSEETHNTLKFAHRSKHMEIKASQNKIMDEKSLIKKYQREISTLKQELQQLRQGIMDKPYQVPCNEEDLVNLKLQLEAGQVKLQSRLEEEEQEKAALMGRIQRLTKLILVSSKNSLPPSIHEKANHRRRHSFGEDELAYLPDRKRETVIDDDLASLDSDFIADGRSDASYLDDSIKDDKKMRRRGMLGWFKLRKPDHLLVSGDAESSTSGSPASQSKFADLKDGRRKSVSRRGEESPSVVDSFPERTQAGELFSASIGGHRLPPTGTTITDQMDLLGEQVKLLAGEVALCTSSLKRLSEQAMKNPEDSLLQAQRQKLKEEIREKKLQMRALEQRMIGSIEVTPRSSNRLEMSQALSKLTSQLNEKTFELEIKTADNRILQEQLQMKISENAEMQETILLLREQLSSFSIRRSTENENCASQTNRGWMNGLDSSEGTPGDGDTLRRVVSGVFTPEEMGCFIDPSANSHLVTQAAEIENLRQEHVRLIEEKDGLQIHSLKLAEEASYAKELAAAAAVELNNLAGEVTKLSYQNAKLTGDLAAAKERASSKNNCSHRSPSFDGKPQDGILIRELQKELIVKCEREASLEAELLGKTERLEELLETIEAAKGREQDLENELANLWVLIAKMRKVENVSEENFQEAKSLSISQTSICNSNTTRNIKGEESAHLDNFVAKDLQTLISRIKGEDLSCLDITTLEALQNLHVEAITKICHAKFSSKKIEGFRS
ncbi:kinesin-like protein KIN-7E, chloroplastic [Aristolochia californica]|uniref:kinesin-like protein KIN-7E, chloroplastic n=1 Tax=Aristolochia californica TaxID=171875 RepID=UPI0035DF39A0